MELSEGTDRSQRKGPTTEVGRWRVLGRDPASATSARRRFGDLLQTIATTSSDLIDCEVIFGELAANGLQHGKGQVTLVLWLEGSNLVLSAKDKGGWSPGDSRAVLPEPLADRGRGMFFIDALGRRIVEPAHAKEIRVVLPAKLSHARRIPK